MNVYINKGVLITPDLILDLGDVYAVNRQRTSPSISFSIRGNCKKDIIVTKDCEVVWGLLTEHYNWEFNEDGMQ